MSEREMLERAAAAAGICGDYGSLFGDEGIIVMRAPGSRIWTGKVWNPLTDDGDALRLAVRLRITPRYYDNAPPDLNLPRVCAVAFTEDGRWFAEAPQRGEELVATRLAITRAAAALAPTAQEE